MEVLVSVFLNLKIIELPWGLELEFTALISNLYHHLLLGILKTMGNTIQNRLSCYKNYLNAYSHSKSASLLS